MHPPGVCRFDQRRLRKLVSLFRFFVQLFDQITLSYDLNMLF